MQLFFQEEISVYHKIFSRESQKSKSGLTILNDLVQKIHERTKTSTNIHEIQRSIRMLSIFSDILQTFNGSIETWVSSIDEHIYNEIMAKSPNTVGFLRVKDWQADLSSYQVDDTFHGIVSYVLNADTKLCYVKDMARNSNVDFKGSLESIFEGIPSYGYIFAVETNQKFLRAVCVDTEPTGMAIRIRLIDIGETISVSPNVYKYNLIERAKRIPPMAILCRVEKCNGKTINTLSSLYKKVYIVKIKDICVNMLEIELNTPSDEDDEEMNDSIQKSIIECIENSIENSDQQNGFQQQQITQAPITPITPNGIRTGAATPNPNPFLNDLPESNNHRAQTPVLANGNGYSQNGTPTKNQTVAPVKTPPGRPSLPPIPPRQRPKSQTPIRIPIELVRRRSNVGQTENGTNGNNHAVNGANMSPEKNVEQNQKVENGFAQNGAHSKMPPTRPEKGFIEMQRPREIELLPTPSKGEEIAVSPTHIVSAENFYVHYIDWIKRFEEFQFSTLQKEQLKQLSYTPKLGDLVLARYGYDGYIYRARIENVEQQHITVFYVDYGNTETTNIDALFEWVSICNTIPFQAVQCRLANIRSIPATSSHSLYEFMHSNYLNKMCKAVVMNVSENALLVRLVNAYGRDVVEEMNSHFHPECIV